jgi:hypothetical protein
MLEVIVEVFTRGEEGTEDAMCKYGYKKPWDLQGEALERQMEEFGCFSAGNKEP